MKNDFTCGFIGLGLIGGSIARALRKFYPECRLLAYDISVLLFVFLPWPLMQP